MKKSLLIALFCGFGGAMATFAQEPAESQQVKYLNEKPSEYISVFQYWKEHNIFQHLDASISLGTTGVGVDLSSPIGNNFQLRAGFSFMPKFDYRMNFGVEMSEHNDQSTYNRLSTILGNLTGYEVHNSVDMIGEPTWNNAHVLIDVFPFKNKHWHFTAGFFVGGSKVAKATNSIEDMATLLALGAYNKMYDKAVVYEPIVKDIDLGKINYTLDDPDILDKFHDNFSYYGRMGVRIGDYAHDIYDENGDLVHAKGTPYMVEPDENGMVKVNVKANSFRPYLGFGYGGRLFKNSDKYKVSFDCGAMFWGGTPSIYTHDGTNLSKDVENIGGKVGTYVDLIKAFKVFPVLNLRLSGTLFETEA